jgi:hypothetical protein
MFNGDTNVENVEEIITLVPVKELFKQHLPLWLGMGYFHTCLEK